MAPTHTPRAFIQEISTEAFREGLQPGIPVDLGRLICPDLFLEEKGGAASCHAASVLLSTGIIRESNVTCHDALKDDGVDAGRCDREAEVVRDRWRITARQPSELGSFCREILAVLAMASCFANEIKQPQSR